MNIKQEKNKVLEQLAEKKAKVAKKLATDTIAMPNAFYGLFGKIFKMTMVTKEAPQGHEYDSSVYLPVFRILGNKLFNKDGIVDAYTWTKDKYQREVEKGHVQNLGMRTEEGKKNLERLTHYLSSKDLFLVSELISHTFCTIVHTDEEVRKVLIVDEEILEATKGTIVDEWVEEDNISLTKIELGDCICCTDKGFYRIGREEFAETHILM